MDGAPRTWREIGIWTEHSPVLVSTTKGSYTQRVGRDCLPMTPDWLIVRQIATRALDVSAALTPVGLESVDELEVERYRQLLPSDESGERQRYRQLLPSYESGERLCRMPTPQLLATLGAIKPLGESDMHEFKGLRASVADIVDAVVCFANGDGGLVLWGVNDDGAIAGTNFRDPDALRNVPRQGSALLRARRPDDSGPMTTLKAHRS